MSPEVREALESARTAPSDLVVTGAETRRRYSLEHVRRVVLSVLQNVPEGTTLSELRDELEISNNQTSDDR